MKLHEIMSAIEEYDLENDDDYKALKLSHLAERKKIVEQKR